MAASMTGFGKGEAEADGYRAQVEIRSVNGRYGDVSIHMPRSFTELESKIKDLVLKVISRGRVDLTVDVKGEFAGKGLPELNCDVLDAYLCGLGEIRKKAQLSDEIDLMTLASLPGMFEFEARELDLEAIWVILEPAIESAVASCQTMREFEGKKLAQDFVNRIQILETHLSKVEDLAPLRVTTLREKVEEKLEGLISPEKVDENRLLMEIAILAERSDITEECVRFHSHNEQFLDTLSRDESVGRRLNFLLQEMLREANTIGSKSGDSDIAHLVVEMKEEIEKMKEQVLNVE